ncbi:MAG: hypothetical protein EP304_07315 [Deltaproteobacteria bacterium]|nr:MAG: hypothetical protein EP304_07315 [Deltaproteobacteria bacterium]
MKYDTQIINEKKIVFCRLEGDPNIDEAVSLAISLREKAAQLGFNVFYDARKMCVPESVMPAHDFSTKLSSLLGTSILRAIKVAFLYEPSRFNSHWKFWEDVSMNRGLQFMGFTDEEEAMEWLSS